MDEMAENSRKSRIGTEHRRLFIRNGAMRDRVDRLSSQTYHGHGLPKSNRLMPCPSSFQTRIVVSAGPTNILHIPLNPSFPCKTSLTPRRFRRPRFLLCRNLPPPLIPKSPLPRPYNPNPRKPRIAPNHSSLWILR